MVKRPYPTVIQVIIRILAFIDNSDLKHWLDLSITQMIVCAVPGSINKHSSTSRWLMAYVNTDNMERDKCHFTNPFDEDIFESDLSASLNLKQLRMLIMVLGTASINYFVVHLSVCQPVRPLFHEQMIVGFKLKFLM